jgi:tetratricopeptide (TPR) repeat protein
VAGIDTKGGEAGGGGASGVPSRNDGVGALTDAGGDETMRIDGPPLALADEPIDQGAILGRYVVLGRLGAGGMGVVHAAYDPELDRKVAIKLLLDGRGQAQSTRARARLIREAQALAKLSHPNVVAVYDAGTVGERVWMAMELVEGQTLTAWIAADPRPWQEVVRVMAAAGEGLCAAHEAGLLHRDFKPDNVMIDADGRVRVMDFGLARPGADVPTKRALKELLEPAGPATSSQAVTGAGVVVGTPGYMAPEQIRGRELDARADQFAFGVSLWHALYGRRPFTGHGVTEVMDRVLAGDVERPPAAVPVPGWLRRVVDRAMANDPAQRFASMRALLDALARGRARGQRRAMLLAVGAVAAAGAGVLGIEHWERGRQLAACEAEGASIDAVWGGEARERVLASFLATGVSHARATADKVLPWIDREAMAWAEHRTGACIRATMERRWNTDTFDRARWCLEDRKLALESLVRVLSEADGSTVARAVTTVAKLEPSVSCLDEGSLERLPPPPAEQDRQRIAEVRSRLARVTALWWVGKAGEGLAVIEEIRAEVSELDWDPLSVDASALESALLQSVGSLDRAEEVGIAAYLRAARSGAWGEAADVASHLAYLVGYTLARPADGRLWAEHAAVAASYAGDPLGIHESMRVTNLAAIALGTGAYDEAGALYERALELQRAAFGSQHLGVGRLLANVGVVAWSKGATADAKQAYEAALAILEEVLGPEHPDLAVVLGNLGALAYDEGNYPEARSLYERVFAIQSAALPPAPPDLAASLDNLALVHNAMGEHDRALALQERAIALWKGAVDPLHPSLGLSYNNLGAIELARGRPTEAREAYEHAVEIYQHSEGVQQHEHEAELALAKLLVQTGGDPARALALARAALDGLRAAGPSKAEEVVEIEAWLATADAKAP